MVTLHCYDEDRVGFVPLKADGMPNKKQTSKKKKALKKTKKRLNKIIKKPTLSSRLKYFFRGTLMILKNADDNDLKTLAIKTVKLQRVNTILDFCIR